MDKMITRSSKHYFEKHTNKNKVDMLSKVLDLSLEAVQGYVNLIIDNKLPLKNVLSSSKLPATVNGIDGGQWKQIFYQQASATVRSNVKKVKDKVYRKYKKVYAYFKKNNRQLKFLETRFSKLNININKRVKIDLKRISINLDERIVNIHEGNHFDNFVSIATPFVMDGKKRLRLNVKIPVKEHKHSLNYKGWERKNTVRLSRDDKGRMYVCFVYQKKVEYNLKATKLVGFDIGYKKLISSSENVHYGEHLYKIYQRLANKKRGSKNYTDLITHKNNEVRRVLNGIDFSDFKTLYVEELKNVKYKTKLSSKLMNKMQYWVYSSVLEKLDMLSEEKGFQIMKVDPAYTSQQCSCCGTIRKSNRKGETYSCSSCNNVMDADYNASINILRKGVYSPSGEQTEFHDFS